MKNHNLELPPLSLVITMTALVLVNFVIVGCTRNKPRRIQTVQQGIDESKTSTDNFREGLRYLSQMTPLNRVQIAKEVQLQLNTWTKTAEPSTIKFSPCKLIDSLPAQLIQSTGIDNLLSLQFSQTDVEYLFQCRLVRMLSNWIVERPLRDSLLVPFLEQQKKVRPEAEFAQLEQACKLFDWTVRNVMLLGDAKDMERLEADPQMPLADENFGYGYLPWQTVLFSRGDFVERGRVFSALAGQRDIQTTWIGIEGEPGTPTKLWCMAVVIGKDLFLFEPKLGLPILDPDSLQIATLDQATTNERVLRRISLPGRFTYAVNSSDLKKLRFLIDAEPCSLLARMQLLESRLLSDFRMRLHFEPDQLEKVLKQHFPTIPVSLWQTPMLAKLYADELSERLKMAGPFSAQYLMQHAVWLSDTPAAVARMKHLRGEFENTLDNKGAASVYMSFRMSDDQLSKLPVDTELQKELGVVPIPGEPREIFDARLRQAQVFFGEAKLDANFMLAQLHFDMGMYDSTVSWLTRWTVNDARAARWFPAAWYTLARAYQEQGKMTECASALVNEPNPMEAGNRLRLRYLTRDDK